MSKTASGLGSLTKETRIGKDGKAYAYWIGQVYTKQINPKTGKPKRKKFSGKTQNEVIKKMRDYALKANAASFAEPSKKTLGSWLETWLDLYCADVKYQTLKSYRSLTKNHIIPQLGAIKLCDLTPEHIQTFYISLSKVGKLTAVKDKDGKFKKDKHGKTLFKGEPLSPKTIHNIHGVLTASLGKAADLNYISSNPALKATPPRVIKPEIDPLDDSYVKLFLDALSQEENAMSRHLFETILFCGLREGEAIGLTWDCIDFDTGTMLIKKQLVKHPADEGGYMFASLKNDKQRTITLSPFMIKVLKERRAQQLQHRMENSKFWQGFSTAKEQQTFFVFTDEVGRHWTHMRIYRKYKKIMEQLGKPESRVHDLRHTFAVLSLENGDDVKTVQENLGHATAAFTLDVYGHVTEKMKKESADRMQNFIENLTEKTS